MINSIFDILNQLGKIASDTTLLKVYKDQKPSTETGDCIVISNMPIKKTNKISINDIIFLFYITKKNGITDFNRISSLCGQLSSSLSTFSSINGICMPNEMIDPNTDNYSIEQTVTQYIFRTINS